jgi:hypothetical protein
LKRNENLPQQTKLKELMATKLSLQKILQGILHKEDIRLIQEDAEKNKSH